MEIRSNEIEVGDGKLINEDNKRRLIEIGGVTYDNPQMLQPRGGRIGWLDVAKAFGMFCIYWGHLGDCIGKGYSFVWQWHVPFFFILAGITAAIKKDSFKDSCKSSIKNLLIPFFVISMMNIVFFYFAKGVGLHDAKMWIWAMARGCSREIADMVVVTPWFISCLFITAIMFQMIRIMKFRPLVLFAAVFLQLLFYKNIMVLNGKMQLWNINYAIRYLLFYAVGYYAFDKLNYLFSSDKNAVKCLKVSLTLLALAYTILLYEGIDVTDFGRDFIRIREADWLIQDTKIIIVAYMMLSLSHCLRKNEKLQLIGKSSLYLCGCENIIKTIIPDLIGMLGLSINYAGEIRSVLYTMFCLIGAIFLVVPFEKLIIDKTRRALYLFFDTLRRKIA